MRIFFLSVALLLTPAFSAWGGEKVICSRTFQLDFKNPGKITGIATTGTKPVSEELRKDSFVLILPKRINFTLSIANDNPDEHHYHIVFTIKDELAPVQKIDGVMLPTDLTKTFWLDAYRYQITMITKESTPANHFISATIKLDVYAPESKPKFKPPEE